MSIEEMAAVVGARLPELFVIFAAVAATIMLATADLLIVLALFDIEVVYE